MTLYPFGTGSFTEIDRIADLAALPARLRATGLGRLRLLEALRDFSLKTEKEIRFYPACVGNVWPRRGETYQGSRPHFSGTPGQACLVREFFEIRLAQLNPEWAEMAGDRCRPFPPV